MVRSKIKLATNVPCRLTLESATGKESNSQFNGLEYMYTCVRAGEPSLIYLPAEARNAIARSGAQAGDEIELTKATAANSAIIYQCRRFSDAHLPVQRTRDYPEGNSPIPPIRMLAPRSQVATAPEPAPFAPLPEEQPKPSYTLSLDAARLGKCLLGAIDICVDAERYAALKGKKLDFNEEDTRAVAISLFIQGGKS